MSPAPLTRMSVSPCSVLPCAGAAVVCPTPAPSHTGPVLGIAVVAAVLAAFRMGSAHPCDRQGGRRAVWFPSLIFLFKDLRRLKALLPLKVQSPEPQRYISKFHILCQTWGLWYSSTPTALCAPTTSLARFALTSLFILPHHFVPSLLGVPSHSHPIFNFLSPSLLPSPAPFLYLHGLSLASLSVLQLPTFSSFPHQPCKIPHPIPSPQA